MSLKKIYQTEDNCTDACIASILKIPLNKVPSMRWAHESGEVWLEALNKWSTKIHKTFFALMNWEDIKSLIALNYNGHIILNVVGDYTEKCGHAIIAKIENKDISIVHDPSIINKNNLGYVGMNRKVLYGILPIKI